MAKNKHIEEKEEVKEAVEVAVSPSKKEFQALIDAYKVQNPVKFAQKEAALKAKLASL